MSFKSLSIVLYQKSTKVYSSSDNPSIFPKWASVLTLFPKWVSVLKLLPKWVSVLTLFPKWASVLTLVGYRLGLGRLINPFMCQSANGRYNSSILIKWHAWKFLNIRNFSTNWYVPIENSIGSALLQIYVYNMYHQVV